MFKVAAGGAIIASVCQLLRRICTYDQLVTAVSTCVLPAGVTLKQIAEGCVILKVQAENVSALDTLWSLYRDGRLKESLQALLVTDKMRAELAGGEHVEVTVTIEQQEYQKAWEELLLIEAEGDFFSEFLYRPCPYYCNYTFNLTLERFSLDCGKGLVLVLVLVLLRPLVG